MKHKAGKMECPECNFSIDLKRISRAEARKVLAEHHHTFHTPKKSFFNTKGAAKQYHNYMSRFKLGVDGGRF